MIYLLIDQHGLNILGWFDMFAILQAIIYIIKRFATVKTDIIFY